MADQTEHLARPDAQAGGLQRLDVPAVDSVGLVNVVELDHWECLLGSAPLRPGRGRGYNAGPASSRPCSARAESAPAPATPAASPRHRRNIPPCSSPGNTAHPEIGRASCRESV